MTDDWRPALSRFITSDPFLAPIPQWAAEIATLCGHILVRLEKIMSDQDTLNTFVANLQTAVTALAAELKTLQSSSGPLDWTAANGVLTSLQALEAPTLPSTSGSTATTTAAASDSTTATPASDSTTAAAPASESTPPATA